MEKINHRLSRWKLVDISKLGMNSNIKKFSYSFICRKGYSPLKGENSFLSTVCHRLSQWKLKLYIIAVKGLEFQDENAKHQQEA